MGRQSGTYQHNSGQHFAQVQWFTADVHNCSFECPDANIIGFRKNSIRVAFKLARENTVSYELQAVEILIANAIF
jgi:hypothetical protein